MARRAVVAVTAGVLVLAALAADAHLAPHAPARTPARALPPVTADDVFVVHPPSPSASASPTPSATASVPPSRPPARTAPPPTPDNLAARLHTLPASSRQVVIVTAPSYTATTATLQTFTKTNGVWQPALGPMTARIGTHGFADRKVEGDLTTPTGMYSFGSTMYGIAANPGVRYRYHLLVADDYWDENPASAGYNTFVHGADPGGGSEALWQVSPQYRYLAVVNYNTPAVAATPPRGSAIFLHEMVPGRATLGCVSLAESDLLRVLRWLDPSAAPRIVLAPTSVLSRY